MKHVSSQHIVGEACFLRYDSPEISDNGRIRAFCAIHVTGYLASMNHSRPQYRKIAKGRIKHDGPNWDDSTHETDSRDKNLPSLTSSYWII